MVATLYKKYSQFILYSIIGVSGVILDFATFLLLYNVFGVSPVIATCISVFVGITNNFILNSLFNFKKKDQVLLRYLSFLSVGLSGLLISTFFVAFGQVFAIDVNLMKLISLPIIVFYQYFLNKSVSFQDIDSRVTLRGIVKSYTVKHWGLILINIVFIVSALCFVKLMPFEDVNNKYAGGPDESVHYRYNVEFLLNHHRLPVSGQDDVAMYKACSYREFGIVPCTYSYQVYPAVNYVFSAIVSQITTSFVSISPVTAARLAAVIWGIVFINFLYLIAHRLTKNRRASWVIASLALIPQVIFTFAYTNQDALSMAVSAICCYALIRLIQEKNLSSILLASFAFGALLPVTKYNFLLLAPFIAVALVYSVFTKRLSFNLVGKVLLGSLVAFLVFSSFWYIRNTFLYHDALGQDFVISEMAKYAPLGHAEPLNIHTLATYTRHDFFETSYRSFFVAFGSMAFYLSDSQYAVLQFLLLALLAGYCYLIYSAKNRRAQVYLSATLIACLALLVCLVGLSFYNSAKYNFQPQGRYFFPILAPLALGLAFAYKTDRRTKYILFGILFIVSYCLFCSADIVIRHYL